MIEYISEGLLLFSSLLLKKGGIVEKKIPEGVTILALIAFFMGIWVIGGVAYSSTFLLPNVSNFWADMCDPRFGFWPPTWIPKFLIGFPPFPYFISMILGILFCVSSYGVLKLKNWARKMLVIISGLSILWPFGFFLLLSKISSPPNTVYRISPSSPSSTNVMEAIIPGTVIISLATIIYFSFSEVKKLFEDETRQELLIMNINLRNNIKKLSLVFAIIFFLISITGLRRGIIREKDQERINNYDLKTLIEKLRGSDQVNTLYLMSGKKFNGQDNIKLLVGSLKDEHWPVRCFAASSLGASHVAYAVPQLINALKQEAANTGSPCVSAIISSLQQITGQNFEYDYVKWQQWWDNNKDKLK